MANDDDEQQEPKPPFGKWLLAQRDRGDWWTGSLTQPAQTARSRRPATQRRYAHTCAGNKLTVTRSPRLTMPRAIGWRSRRC